MKVNEFIKSSGICGSNIDNPDYVYEISHHELEKFAELIIRKCAEIALVEEHDPSDCILNYFGVKR